MQNKKVYLYIGTTAELIKLVPLVKEFNKRKIVFTIIASGQNLIKFSEFSGEIGNVEIIHAITPKGDESSVIQFILWAIRAFLALLIWMRMGFKGLNKSNCYFIIHGDTVSSLMGALAAYVYGLKLVHVESGLRSFHYFEPFPEEICRSIISRLADIHFCPNEWCVQNLKKKHGKKINTYQNTLIEVFWSAMKKPHNQKLITTITADTRFFVMVCHRQEHIIFNKERTQDTIKFILDNIPDDLNCVFIMHDLSKDFIESLKIEIGKKIAKSVILTNRLPYAEYMHLIEQSEFMITDGGSNQEEMYYMGKPCLLLRNATERIEGLNRNVVLSKNRKDIISRFLKFYSAYKSEPITSYTSPSKIIAESLFQ